MKQVDFYISCGGTGGHFYPGLSIARELQKQNKGVKLLLSGVNSRPQSQAAAAQNITSVVLPHMPSPGKNPLRWLQFLAGLAGGFIITFFHFCAKRPRGVIIMGSFASAPAALAAKILLVPVFLHDGNARVGKANRFLSRWAKALCTAFPAVNQAQCRCRPVCTGMPVRPELEAKRFIEKSEAISLLNKEFQSTLATEKYTILIFGGSQGAATLNKTLPMALKELTGFDFQVIHLTGKGKKAETLALYENVTFPHLVLESSPLMELFLGSADLVFSRSGGSSVAELALFGKNAVLIPYPYAAEGHQADNAAFYVQAGAGEMVSDSQFTQRCAAEILTRHLSAPAVGKERALAARKAACPEAAAAFLKHIENL
jgi:UDP-N-acetylglucosamine--N-acetylmuramyl-(pentapeptide) pyrophosphoryl-undecaprenol N-acetylglucosamine transferase